jgi:hypothetical protein
MTQKESQQRHIKDTVESVQRLADNFKSEKTKIESEWDKYFKEIQKHSNKFELVKTQKTSAWDVQVYMVDSEGKYNYNSQRVKVGNISQDYNEMSIVYKGELPEGCNANRINIYVEEHITTPRGGWRSKSNGFKLRVSVNHDDNKTYYKTGRPVVKIVEEYAQGLWNEHNRKVKENELRMKAFGEAFKRYRNSIVDFGGNRVNNINTNRNQIVVKNPNGSMVILNYSEINGEIEFNVQQVYLGPNSADSVIEALGNMK